MKTINLSLIRLGVMSLLLFQFSCSSKRPPEVDKKETQGAVTSEASPSDTSDSLAVEPLSVVRPSSDVVVPVGSRPAAKRVQCGGARYENSYSPGYAISSEAQKQADAMSASLSLKEKADQMRGVPSKVLKGIEEQKNWDDIFRTPDNTEKGIRGFLFRDGPRGVNLDAECPMGKECYSTVFPVEIGRGASFDADLEYLIAKAHGDETLASGHTMMLAPSINIVRHPAWGRTQESYGEDSFLLGRMGTAYVAGVQEYVPACPKHFAANNVEVDRRITNAVMDEQTLREIYGVAFEMTVRDGGAACIMASYNKLNGVNAAEHKHLLTEILRNDFGFKGFVLSDWWALDNEFETDLPLEKYENTAKRSLEAGMDLEMPWALNYKYLEKLAEKNEISAASIDLSARRILEQKYRFNIADINKEPGLTKPTTRLDDNRSIQGNEKHIDLAYESALKSMVLLKNDNNTLPINRDKVKTVAVLGARVPYEQRKYASKPSGTIDFAKDPSLGDLGSSRANADPKKSFGPYDGIDLAAGGTIKVITSDKAEAAKNADFIVVVAGLTPGDEGEEYTGAGDRKSFAIDAKVNNKTQEKLIRSAAALGKPMAVVLVGGSVIDMPWLNEVPAVIMSWYSGMQGGRALGDLLFGKKNFSGKLPLSWPNNWDELPVFDPGVPNDVPMDYYLGYRYYDKKGIKPLYFFGHGISYTSFAYDNLEVPCETASKNSVAEIKVDVVNKGAVAGEEIVFLFVSYPDTAARRSVKELKGFTRVVLEAGQAKQVTIPLPISSLKYWNMSQNKWDIESGKVKIMVGGSSFGPFLTEEFVVK